MKTATLTAAVLGAALCFSRVFAADLQPLQWHAGMSASEVQRARVVRIAPGFHAADLAQLRDDQMIETPSGHRVLVRNLRAMRQAFAEAKARGTSGPVVALKVLPRPTKPCSPLRRGETLAQILARPSGDVVCLPSGRSASVAQLQALVPFMQRYRLGQHPIAAARSRASLSGPTISVASGDEAMRQIRTAPDSTVLVDAQGRRATVGDLKAFLVQHGRLVKALGDARQGGKP